MNVNSNDCNQRKTTCTFIYLYKAKKNCETFVYRQKSRHFAKRNLKAKNRSCLRTDFFKGQILRALLSNKNEILHYGKSQ